MIDEFLHDIEEEEMDANSRHGKKLAVVFGLAGTVEESVIWIAKKLGVCPDCHIVMKLILKVYKWVIVARDLGWFHAVRMVPLLAVMRLVKKHDPR